MKKMTMYLSIASLCLIAMVGVQETFAYFTTYAEASGQKRIDLYSDTTIEEEFPEGSWTKRISVKAEQNSIPVWVRVRAFSGTEYPLQFTSVSGKWVEKGEYWYYQDIVTPQQPTDELLITIDAEQSEEHDFNVIVVSESVPVQYDESGNPLEANWNEQIEIERP